jgi:predicted methyltransferase
MLTDDVPSPIDLRLMAHAREWEVTAVEKRPWRAGFVDANVKDPTWPDSLPRVDAVVINQAVHELRHKRYAAALHRQVNTILRPGGSYLVCDHFCGPGGMNNDQLFMSVDEQRLAIESAGYASVRQVLLKGGMVLHHARSDAT